MSAETLSRGRTRGKGERCLANAAAFGEEENIEMGPSKLGRYGGWIETKVGSVKMDRLLIKAGCEFIPLSILFSFPLLY